MVEQTRGDSEMIQEAGEQKSKKQHRQSPEMQLQAKCVLAAWNDFPQTRKLLFHVENESNRADSNPILGAIRKAQGIVAGVADLILLIPRGQYHGLMIEMKTMDRNSNQKPAQKEWQKLVEAQGYRYEIIRTEEDFRSLLTEYLALPAKK